MTAGLGNRAIKRLGSLNDIILILTYFIKYCGIYVGLLALNFFRKMVSWMDMRLLITFLFIYVGILFIIYLGTPSNLEWHLGTSFKRAILPINVTILGVILYTFRSR
jgi:hypothetical protein